MKIGESINLSIDGGHNVAQAYIEDVSEGKVTFVIPATRFIMAIKESLAVPESENTERVFGGVVEERDTASDAKDEANNNTDTPAPTAVETTDSLRNANLDSSAID